jgi:Skp family chaperone for outer membrane proteins
LAPDSPYLALASVPEALNANAKPVPTMAEQKDLEKLHAQDQREIKALKKELQRKEKALAEAAATANSAAPQS